MYTHIIHIYIYIHIYVSCRGPEGPGRLAGALPPAHQERRPQIRARGPDR